MKPRNPAALAAQQLEEARAHTGRCTHCRRGTAWGIEPTTGKALCPRCAGWVQRKGVLPEVVR